MLLIDYRCNSNALVYGLEWAGIGEICLLDRRHCHKVFSGPPHNSDCYDAVRMWSITGECYIKHQIHHSKINISR